MKSTADMLADFFNYLQENPDFLDKLAAETNTHRIFIIIGREIKKNRTPEKDFMFKKLFEKMK